VRRARGRSKEREDALQVYGEEDSYISNSGEDADYVQKRKISREKRKRGLLTVGGLTTHRQKVPVEKKKTTKDALSQKKSFTTLSFWEA